MKCGYKTDEKDGCCSSMKMGGCEGADGYHDNVRVEGRTWGGGAKPIHHH